MSKKMLKKPEETVATLPLRNLPGHLIRRLQQIAVGIEDQSNINDFNLYPNPTNSELFIENEVARLIELERRV